MKPIFMFVFLILGVCLVIHLSVSKIICGGEEYTIVHPNGTFKRCLPCAKCLPGRGLKPKCGSTVQHPPNIDCHSCEPGEFSSEFDSSSCLACHQCVKYQLITAHCTNKSDTVCSGKCKKGYYLSKTAPHNCQKCSCCLDGKDEKIPECVNQGINNEHCGARPDKVCGGTTDASKGGSLSTTSIILIVLGCFIAVVIVVLLIVMTWRQYHRRKRNGRQQLQGPEEPAREQSSGSASYAMEGPRAEPSATNQNHLYQGTPEIERDRERSKSPQAPRHDANQQQSDSSLIKATAVVTFEEQVKLPEEKSSVKPSLSRQGSQDSQTSGDGEAKFRKRSGSSLGIEKLKRKLSVKDDSLIEEVPDEEHEPIKFIKHPKSQTAKEGSKIEFTCKVQGKSSRLLYQWFKDDGSVRGQTEASLVLKSVELRDFGRYKCYVSYEDRFGEGETSSPAVLNVIPQHLNGMRPKFLRELDITTRDEIASLLENKIFGLGGCRQVAAIYGMKEHQVESLKNSKEPGKDVLDFLKGFKPNLTVYNFCKELKEDKIERFDVVQKLEDHFLIREGTEYV